MIEIIGSIGAILLGLCGVPQAYKSYTEKHSDGVSWGFLNMWFFGEILLLAYIIVTNPDIILIANYVVNLVTVAVIIKYKFKE